uniref:Uncharacterized protein n=1 Tax=Arundo donax TaxID=35708 RepID=A0A0A8ZJV7_ARUDO
MTHSSPACSRKKY